MPLPGRGATAPPSPGLGTPPLLWVAAALGLLVLGFGYVTMTQAHAILFPEPYAYLRPCVGTAILIAATMGPVALCLHLMLLPRLPPHAADTLRGALRVLALFLVLTLPLGILAWAGTYSVVSP